jgi:hypothetical protein
MDRKKTTPIDAKRNSRRGFIKKTSMVAGVSVLPASNVWGVCNVSGVSGGSLTTSQSCVVTQFSGGYQPSYWEKLAQYEPSSNDSKALAELLLDVSTTDRFDSNPQALKMEGYYPYVRAMLDKHIIQIQGGGRIPQLSINVGHTMRTRSTNNSKTKHLAAVYINCLFGFVNLEAQFSGKDGLALFIEHIWGSLHEGSYSNTMSVLRNSYKGINKLSENQLKAVLRNNHVL